jgi:hypothetical protein
VFLLGMVATAGYAARTLPAGARVPVNAGTPEHSLWLPKPAGLVAWLGAGAVTFTAFAALTLSGLAANWATSLRVVLLPCAMLVVLAAEAGAVISARQRCEAGLAPATELDAALTEPDAAPTEPDAALTEPDAAANGAPEVAAAEEAGGAMSPPDSSDGPEASAAQPPLVITSD